MATRAVFILCQLHSCFFNFALIAAALERLRGGDPNVKSGLLHALAHTHHIFLWSLIVAAISVLVALIKGKRNSGFIRHIVGTAIEAGWTMITFFVIPIIVSEDRRPFAAIKRSIHLFKRTWGEQIISTAGFGVLRTLSLIICLGIGWVFGNIFGEQLGLVVLILTAVIVCSIIYTLEGIYKAALYEFALGETPLEFKQEELRTAFLPEKLVTG